MSTLKRFQMPLIRAALLLATASGLMTGWTPRPTAPLAQGYLRLLNEWIRSPRHPVPSPAQAPAMETPRA